MVLRRHPIFFFKEQTEITEVETSEEIKEPESDVKEPATDAEVPSKSPAKPGELQCKKSEKIYSICLHRMAKDLSLFHMYSNNSHQMSRLIHDESSLGANDSLVFQLWLVFQLCGSGVNECCNW